MPPTTNLPSYYLDEPPGGDEEQPYPAWLEEEDECRDYAEEAYNADPENFI